MKKFQTVLVVTTVIAIMACKKTENDTTTNTETTNYASLTITHDNGADFSAGAGSADWNNQDGYTTSWPIGGSQPGLYGFWYSAYDFTSIKWIGPGELSAVSSIDTTSWDTQNANHPLKKGEIWVAKCRDGFVKFKVTSDVPTDSVGVANSTNNAVTVDFEFSTTNTFN